MNREYFVLVLLITICILLWTVQQELETSLYIKDPQYEEMLSETSFLKIENEELRNELLQKESYTTIAQEAKKQGFIPATYITLPER